MTDTRRQFLALSGAALASLTGCVSDGGPATEDPPTETAPPSPTETATPTAAETATETTVPDGPPNAGYARWLPAPAAFDADHYAFTSVATGELVEMKDDFGDGAVSEFEEEVGVPGVETYADARAIHQIDGTIMVFEVDRDRTAVERAYAERDFSAAGTREGFTVFTDGAGAAAVGDGALVTALGLGDASAARAAVEAVVDARAGAAARYVEAVPACDALTDALGTGHLVRGRTHEPGDTFAGAVGVGLAFRAGDTETTAATPVVFAEGEADENAVAEWADGADVFYGREPEMAVDGRTVTATAAVPSAEIERFRSQLPGDAAPDDRRTPAVSFAFEYEAGGDGRGVLTVTHEGGDSIPRNALSLRGSGFADVDGVDQTDAGQWQGGAGDDGTVRAGDRVTVGVESDYELRVVWEAPDGDAAATLAVQEGPDA